jgi:hypothetical protein
MLSIAGDGEARAVLTSLEHTTSPKSHWRTCARTPQRKSK